MRDVAAIATLLTSSIAFAEPPQGAATQAPGQPAPARSEPEGANAWSFDASAYLYFVNDGRDYVQPTARSDRGSLHLEGRYNYEDLDTGSAWLGWNFSVGQEVAFEFTPMIAGVVGNTSGFATGYVGALRWKRLDLDSESEYLIDSGGASDNFFYNWSQLTLAPAERFYFGVVLQRTQAYESERDTQRGLIAGYSRENKTVSAVLFNPDDDRPMFVLVFDIAF